MLRVLLEPFSAVWVGGFTRASDSPAPLQPWAFVLSLAFQK